MTVRTTGINPESSATNTKILINSRHSDHESEVSRPFCIVKLCCLVCLVVLTSCASDTIIKEEKWQEDFSLSEDKADLDSSSVALVPPIEADSSLPLAINIRTTSENFQYIPQMAREQAQAVFHLNQGDCQVQIKTAAIVIDQFLWTGRWIAFKKAWRAHSTILLDPKEILYLSANMALDIEIMKPAWAACRKLWRGKKTLLGRFDLNHSRMSLVGTQDSPRVGFKAREAVVPTEVYLNWPRHSKDPQLLSRDDVPIALRTPKFRGAFGSSGSYYLMVKPLLNFEASPQAPHKNSPSSP